MCFVTWVIFFNLIILPKLDVQMFIVLIMDIFVLDFKGQTSRVSPSRMLPLVF